MTRPSHALLAFITACALLLSASPSVAQEPEPLSMGYQGHLTDLAGNAYNGERQITFRLYDALGRETHHFCGDRVHFTPGSAAITVLDGQTGEIRPPTTADYVRYVKVVGGLPHIENEQAITNKLWPTKLQPFDIVQKLIAHMLSKFEMGAGMHGNRIVS